MLLGEFLLRVKSPIATANLQKCNSTLLVVSVYPAYYNRNSRFLCNSFIFFINFIFSLPTKWGSLNVMTLQHDFWMHKFQTNFKNYLNK